MMPRQSPQTNSRARRPAGFSTIELLVVATLLTVITAFGFIGISKARASVRLNGAARELAAYIEKTRIHSIRKHADDAAQRARVAFNTNKTSYDVTMDLDGDGTMDTRTIDLPSDVSFDPTDNLELVAFDWRGRTWRTANGVTEQNAQVSIRMQNTDDYVTIDVTGSGDVTIDSRVFDDSVPNVNLHVGDLTASASPGATPLSDPSPDAAASPSLVPPLEEVLPSPTPDLGGLPLASPTPGSSPSPSASPSASPSPGAHPSPSPSASPVEACTITTDKTLVTIGLDGTATISVGHSSNTTIAITGTSSKPSDLQVTPGGVQNVSAGGNATFTLKSKRSIGDYSVTFSSNCGSKTVPVTVVSLSLF